MITKDQIKQFVSDYYGLEDLFIKSNFDKYVIPRRYFVFLCYEYCQEIINTSILRDYMGVKDHTLISHHLKKLDHNLQYDKRTKKEVSQLINAFKQSFEVIDEIDLTSKYNLLEKRKIRELIALNNRKNYKISYLKSKIKKLENARCY